MNKILILAPHPDDGEFGCGGSLNRFAEEGKEIWYVAFSPCNKSLPKGYAENQLFEELKNATGKLGIVESHLKTFQFPVREFPNYRQDILEELTSLKKEINPDLVLIPNSKDIHQDHHTIYKEGIRAFKHCKLLGYELPWNNLRFDNTFHIKLDKKHLNAKMGALQEYKSQQFRPYMSEEFLMGLARTRGIQINADYAEAFELIRWYI